MRRGKAERARGGDVDREIGDAAMFYLDFLDALGLDGMDRRILESLAKHGGQPVGVKTVAVMVGETPGIGIEGSRFPAGERPEADPSHSAMRVNLDACINCGLCVRACREVQVNDVIGLAYRGAGSKIVFDLDDPMGASTCVACGECVQACPTGALVEKSLVDAAGVRAVEIERSVDT